VVAVRVVPGPERVPAAGRAVTVHAMSIVPPAHPRSLAALRAPQVAELVTERSILVLPVGAVEQHGPHLPYDTDLLVATAVAEAALRDAGERLHAWLLPPLAYTKSNEHAWDAGTVWLSAQTLLATLMDIGRSVAQLPARKLVFLNGHGGNSALLQVVNRELRLAHGLLTFLAHPGLPPDQGGASPASELGMGIHGGEDETSLLLHLAAERVDLAAARRNVPEWLAGNRHVRFGGRVAFGWLSDDFGPTGLIGDPTGATAERGKELFEGSVAGFVQALEEVAAFELPDRRSRS
jgi:creatinine amidohydrolase